MVCSERGHEPHEAKTFRAGNQPRESLSNRHRADDRGALWTICSHQLSHLRWDFYYDVRSVGNGLEYRWWICGTELLVYGFVHVHGMLCFRNRLFQFPYQPLDRHVGGCACGGSAGVVVGEYCL